MEELETALQRNRELQCLLRQKLISIQRSLARNIYQQNQIESQGKSLGAATVLELNEDGNLRTPASAGSHPAAGAFAQPVFEEFYKCRLRNVRRTGAEGYVSHFCDKDMKSAKENKDSLKKKKLFRELAEHRNEASWSKVALYLLKGFVSKKGRASLKRSAKKCIADATKLSSELDRLKQLPRFCDEIMAVEPASIKWEPLRDKELGCVHTPLECKQKWLHEFSKARKWTKAEDDIVLGFSPECSTLRKKFQYWENICLTEKKIKRTPFACMQRYLGKKNTGADHKKKGWERTEQVLLKNAVSTYGEHDWETVVSVLPKIHRPTAAKRQWAYMKLNCIDKKIEGDIQENPAILGNVERLEEVIDMPGTKVDDFLVNSKEADSLKNMVKSNKYWSRSDSRRLTFAVNAIDTKVESDVVYKKKRYRTIKFWSAVSELIPWKPPDECRDQYKRLQTNLFKRKQPGSRKRKAPSRAVINKRLASRKTKSVKKEKLYMDDIDFGEGIMPAYMTV